MRAREYRLMEESVEIAAVCAVNRFFKYRTTLDYTDDDGRRDLQATIERAVMDAISERFEFDCPHDTGHDIDHL